MPKVTGSLTLYWSVDLPTQPKERWQGMCEDPAKEAVLDFIPQSGKIYLWGEDKEPADVWLEAHEEDVEIDDDEREGK